MRNQFWWQRAIVKIFTFFLTDAELRRRKKEVSEITLLYLSWLMKVVKTGRAANKENRTGVLDTRPQLFEGRITLYIE